MLLWVEAIVLSLMEQQSIQSILEKFLHSREPLNEDEIQRLVHEEPELAKLLILELVGRLREMPTPDLSTPSGMVPIYEKPAANGRKKKQGRKEGHKGERRPTPLKIDKEYEHPLEQCPDCGGEVRPYGPKSQRPRIIEDIPEEIKPVVTKHILPRGYCPNCKKSVEPRIPDALPKAQIGNRLLSLTAHWHYGLGMTLSQIVGVLGYHLHFTVSAGGLVRMWHRLAEILYVWYEELVDEVQHSVKLHADETGWRVNGKTHWLWCFSNNTTTVYLIHPSRGSPALDEFFKEAFEGALITDFWAAYDAIAKGDRQFCLAHLLRELKKVDNSNSSEEWCAYSKKAKRLFHDALKLRAQKDYSPQKYASRIQCLEGRLVDLALVESTDADVRRLAKRLHKYWDELLTFLKKPHVPPTNNHAEREIRPAVIMRKVMQGNQTDQGARTQAVLMSIYRTLKRRGLNPAYEITQALSRFILSKQLPTMPKTPSDG